MPMEANGQKASNPGARLASLLTKREKLQDELRNIEKQVFELETTYLQDSNHFGHVLKGFEGFLGSSKSATKIIGHVPVFDNLLLKRPRKFQPEDRIFSLSSVTSPAVEENAGGRDDIGPGRSKGGGLPTNGQGKPKKGRLTS
ncbi:chromatin modification-related protein MEAF6-like isoform X1 [Chenopodium quinoa]|uniref:chromatin modification-related protein MEAF6-like isoform X1 n=1 Tax=Chenopodium quinoa TaxID=63459 RepID=UPI000B781FA0|nr:chromatin modification-related protein MEAF6-like isoform X1 [Chenopodium quinoa]